MEGCEPFLEWLAFVDGNFVILFGQYVIGNALWPEGGVEFVLRERGCGVSGSATVCVALPGDGHPF